MKSFLRTFLVRLGIAVSTGAAMGAAETPTAASKPVKVFILAGQSNMQGKGSLKHLSELVTNEPAKFGHLKKDGKWIERDDVFIIFPSLGGRDKDQKGKLSVGYT